MNDAPGTECCPARGDRRGPKLFDIPPAPPGRRQSGLPAGETAAVPRLVREAGETPQGSPCAQAIAEELVFAPARGRLVRPWLIAAPCGLAWAIFWMLLLLAAFSPSYPWSGH